MWCMSQLTLNEDDNGLSWNWSAHFMGINREVINISQDCDPESQISDWSYDKTFSMLSSKAK